MRRLVTLGGMLTLLWALPAAAQTPPPPPPAAGAPGAPGASIQGLERLSPEERAIAERNLERWRNMTPEQRQQAREQIRQRRLERPREIRPQAQSFERRPR